MRASRSTTSSLITTQANSINVAYPDLQAYFSNAQSGNNTSDIIDNVT